MNEQNPLDPLHVNDRVIVVEDTSGCFPHTVGLEGVVVGEEGTHLCTLPWPAVVVGYEVELEDGAKYVFLRRELKRKRPPAPEMKGIRALVEDVLLNGLPLDATYKKRLTHVGVG